MRPVSIKLKDMAIANIQLGFVGENNATQVVFDCKEIFDENPYAVQLLVVTPPEGTTYEVTTARIGDDVVWNVSELDTAYEGDGSIQLVFTDGGQVIKTYNADTTVLESQVPSGTAPATALNWIQDAEAWAKGTRGGRAVESDDPTYQNNSKYYSQQIVDMASDSEAYAKGTRNGETVESDDPAYHNNSKYYAESIADTASDSEAYAAGTRGGEAVDEEDPAYHNNAAYYNEQAALEKAAAQAAAETASAAYNVNLLAANYDATKTYAVGEYVIYSGGLKRCIVPITTAEAWTSAHWADVTVGKDVTALKSALDEKTDTINGIIAVQEMVPLPFTIAGSGYIASNGTVGSSSNYKYTDYIPIGDFEKLRYKRGGSTGSSSQYAAVYDKNKNFIASSRWATNQTSAGYLETLSNITNADDRYYVRFTTYADTDTYGEFAVYGENHPLYKRITDVEAEVDTKISSETEIGKNLFDPTKGTSGYLKSNGGISSDSDYITSDFIPIANGQSVNINRIRKFLAYDSSKTVISDTYVDALTTGYVFTASQDGFIRATLYTSYASQNMIVYGNVLGMYEPYWEKTVPEEDVHLSPDMRSDAAKLSGNVLDGKKWVACGDSFTHGDFSDSQTQDYTFTDIPYYGQYKVYPYWIGRRNQGMTVINEAINGSTMTGGSSGVNPFSGTRYTEIPADADYITMMFGINDAGNSCPIGTIDDETNETFYGAWNVVLNYLITNFPYAHIGIIVGPGMQTSTGKQYANAEIAVAKKWGIPYLNIQYESGGEKIPLMLRTSNPDVSSTVKALRDSQQFVSDVQGASNHHPNAKAHEFESTFIEAWLKTL